MYNQATNFREAVIENMGQVFLGQGHFEEAVTWYDSDGATARTITVSDVSAVGQQQQEQHHLATERSVQFMVQNDATLGTTDPSLGNKIVRSDGTKWGFKRIVASDFSGWILEFVGGKLERNGMGRQAHL